MKYILIPNPIEIKAKSEAEALSKVYEEPWKYVQINLIEEVEDERATSVRKRS